ncbi:MAG TPA: hypothetical protein VFR55_01285, partial [Dehalococcoidia bacterium]|nr:hypothetical protein [Dehalococcoidia bacterium]
REIVQILRRIAPPDYLQAEVEANLQRAVEYFGGERDALELEIDLRELLPRVKLNIFEYVDRLIDELDIVDIDPTQDPLDQLADVEELINAIVWDIASGKNPEAVPAIAIIPAPLRAGVFDSLLPSVLNDPRIDLRVRRGLAANVTSIRREFIAGDTRRFLKEVAHAGLTPLIDQGIAGLNRYTDEPGQLDLIAIAAHNSDGITEVTLRDRLDGIRDQFRRGATLGGSVALTVAIVATVVMFLIYLPSLTNAMRWPGLTLLLTGLVLVVLGKLLESTLPGLINALVEEQILKVADLPPTAVTLVNDLAQQFTNHLFTGLANPALIILLSGASLFGGSFLVPLLRPVAPWIR